jgi:hypothetical protein
MTPTPTPAITVTVVTGGSSLVPVLALVVSVFAAGFSGVVAWFEIFKWRQEQPTLEVQAWANETRRPDEPDGTYVVSGLIINPGREPLSLSEVYLTADTSFSYDSVDQPVEPKEVAAHGNAKFREVLMNVGAVEGVELLTFRLVVVRGDQVVHNSNPVPVRPTRVINVGLPRKA